VKKIEDLPYKIGKKPNSAKNVPNTGKDKELVDRYIRGIIDRTNKKHEKMFKRLAEEERP